MKNEDTKTTPKKKETVLPKPNAISTRLILVVLPFLFCLVIALLITAIFLAPFACIAFVLKEFISFLDAKNRRKQNLKLKIHGINHTQF